MESGVSLQIGPDSHNSDDSKRANPKARKARGATDMQRGFLTHIAD